MSGRGLSHRMHLKLAAELSAARKRIAELESLIDMRPGIAPPAEAISVSASAIPHAPYCHPAPEPPHRCICGALPEGE